MWIVRLALRRPYTVAVMSFLMLLLGILSLTRMVVDIFPSVDIPVVMVVWSYPGLSAEDMERRVTLISERAYSTTVNGIERIESQSIRGHRPAQGLLPAGLGHRRRHRPDKLGSSTILRIVPPGMHAAQRHPVQRLERAGGPADDLKRQHPRGAPVRLRTQLHPRPPVYDSGSVHAGALWRQDPRDRHRYRSPSALSARVCRRKTW